MHRPAPFTSRDNSTQTGGRPPGSLDSGIYSCRGQAIAVAGINTCDGGKSEHHRTTVVGNAHRLLVVESGTVPQKTHRRWLGASTSREAGHRQG